MISSISKIPKPQNAPSVASAVTSIGTSSNINEITINTTIKTNCIAALLSDMKLIISVKSIKYKLLIKLY